MSALVTIKENNIFRRLYKSKKCYVYPQIVVYVAKNNLGIFRYGITVSKKVGGAVVRTRCRRVIRSALYTYADQLTDAYNGESGKRGFDVVIVARRKTAFIKSTELVQPIFDAFSKAGIL